MLGRGAMVFWHDFAPGTDEVDFHEWHSKEHIPERVGVPGFRRGYRHQVIEGGPTIFVMYEVDDLTVLISEAYLERLNDPSPWTKKAMAYFANSSRTLCSVSEDCGRGIGGLALTVQLAPAQGRAEDLRGWLCGEVLPAAVQQPGILAAQLLEADEAASRTETQEKKMRGTADQVADWVIVVRGYDEAALRHLRDGQLGEASLERRGAAGRQAVGLYRLLDCVTDVDLAGG